MKLRELRTSKNLTQKQVAEAIGESEVNYNRYEKGKVNIDINRLIKLADFYNASLDYLCDHPYNNQIGYIPEERKEVVRKILKIDEKYLDKVDGFISALLN